MGYLDYYFPKTLAALEQIGVAGRVVVVVVVKSNCCYKKWPDWEYCAAEYQSESYFHQLESSLGTIQGFGYEESVVAFVEIVVVVVAAVETQTLDSDVDSSVLDPGPALQLVVCVAGEPQRD